MAKPIYHSAIPWFGPVRAWWMFPFERFMRQVIKTCNKNQICWCLAILFDFSHSFWLHPTTQDNWRRPSLPPFCVLPTSKLCWNQKNYPPPFPCWFLKFWGMSKHHRPPNQIAFYIDPPSPLRSCNSWWIRLIWSVHQNTSHRTITFNYNKLNVFFSILFWVSYGL